MPIRRILSFRIETWELCRSALGCHFRTIPWSLIRKLNTRDLSLVTIVCGLPHGWAPYTQDKNKSTMHCDKTVPCVPDRQALLWASFNRASPIESPPHRTSSLSLLCRVSSTKYLEQQVRYLFQSQMHISKYQGIILEDSLLLKIICTVSTALCANLTSAILLLSPYCSITLNNSKRWRPIIILVHENGHKDQLAMEPLIPEQDTCRLAAEPPTVDWAPSSRSLSPWFIFEIPEIQFTGFRTLAKILSTGC